MKAPLILLFLSFILMTCRKNDPRPVPCNMQQIYAENASKATLSKGLWGTVAFMEGNCMPSPGMESTCKTCPVKRILRIYEYTLKSQATPQSTARFYTGFSTQLIKEVYTDEHGFFQTDIPAGHYTVVVVEDGKLHALYFDGQGGINPVTFSGGKQNLNLTLTYKAVF